MKRGLWMRKAFAVLVFCCTMVGGAFCGDDSGVRHGTINVAVANDNGIVILTDSMLTETRRDATGVHDRQLATPGQKLFRIDDKTVCTFAGFAAAPTDSIPDFLNNVPSIIGRYRDRLKHITNPPTFSQKLNVLEEIVRYYLTGIANIRDGSPPDEYRFQLFLAGYDIDGTAKVGRMELVTVPEPRAAGPILRSITQEKIIFTIAHNQMVCLNGITDVARKILDSSHEWTGDQGACQQSASNQKPLSVEQMKKLAVSLKEHTADKYPGVGGPNQIAVLRGGRVHIPTEQPIFKPIKLSGFQFRIVDMARFIYEDRPGMPASPKNSAVVSGLYALFFGDEWINVGQDLDYSYFRKNTFKNSRLMYRGGKTYLDKSNQVIDCDLEIAKGVSEESPVVKQLVKNFGWRTVKYQVPMNPSLGHPQLTRKFL
jgi:hypothetical protein